MLNEFKELRELIANPNANKDVHSKEVLAQMMLLEIKLLEIQNRMDCAKKVLNELHTTIDNNSDKKLLGISIQLTHDEYDKVHYATNDIGHLLDMDSDYCVKENWHNMFPPIELPNILREDFVAWDTKNNCPKESLDIVYHYTSLIQLMNDGMQLEEDEEFVCIKNIPLRWQVLYDAEIERNK
jgi:hypothetical protein